MRDLHVPRRARVDLDEPVEIHTSSDRDLDLTGIADEQVVPAEDLA